jgi:hypothetical protein
MQRKNLIEKEMGPKTRKLKRQDSTERTLTRQKSSKKMLKKNVSAEKKLSSDMVRRVERSEKKKAPKASEELKESEASQITQRRRTTYSPSSKGAADQNFPTPELFSYFKKEKATLNKYYNSLRP